MSSRVATFASLVKLSHTIFAAPFAIAAETCAARSGSRRPVRNDRGAPASRRTPRSPRVLRRAAGRADRVKPCAYFSSASRYSRSTFDCVHSFSCSIWGSRPGRTT